MKVADFVTKGSISGARLRSAGYGGVIRYLGGNGTCTRAEVADFQANGISLGLVFEQNEPNALFGADKGEAQARQAAREAAELVGYPAGCVIFMACDTDPRQNRNAVIEYYRAAAPILRASGYRPGGYLGDDPGVALLDEGTIEVLWQPKATSWSANYPSPRAHLVQRVDQPVVLGNDYDHNDVQAQPLHFWGQAAPEEDDDVKAMLAKLPDDDTVWICFRSSGTRRKLEPGGERTALVSDGVLDPALPAAPITPDGVAIRAPDWFSAFAVN